MIKLSRREMIAGALVAAPAVLSGRARAEDLRPISFTLPWVAEGSNAYAFVAKANGYWTKRGLDVQIVRGYGSTAAAQAIGAGRFQFGLAAAPSGIQAAAKGLPVVALGSAGYDATMGICVLDDSPIKSPKDLEGRKMASTVNSGDYPFLGVYAERAGFDISKVSRVQADPAVRQRLLISKEVDAISGFAISFAPVFETEKISVRNMLYSAAGLTLYNNSLMTQLETLQKEPKLCADICDGLAEAIKFTMLNPDEALQIFLKQVPEMALTANGPASVRVGMGIFNLSMMHEPMIKNGIGFSAPADYESMTDLVMKYVAEPADKKPEQKALFTNDFAGKVKLTPAEHEEAIKKSMPFRKFLA